MKKIIFILLGVILLTTCKHQSTQNPIGSGNPIDNPVVTPTNDSVCFSSQILPMILANCAQTGCHNAVDRAEGLVLTTYTSISNLVKNNVLVSSITTTSSKRMPYRQPAMDTASINLIKRWIKEGSKNRTCTTNACDTANVLYSTHISPVINTYCKGCHNAGNKGGNINLDNYTDVKTQTSTGNLICAISFTGCKNMPQTGSKLSTCNIRKFIIWKNHNFPQ